jgi:opacity protein-like surface antigen
MKKIILLLVVIFIATTSIAQVSAGLKVGASFASVQAAAKGEKASTSNRTALALGGFVNFSVSEKFKIQPELLYQGMGGSVGGETFKSEYVNIPILAQYAVTQNFKIEAGPQFGILASSKSAGEDIKDDFKTSDFQLLFGASINVTDAIGIGARYGTSMSSIAADVDKAYNDINTSVKNKAFTVMLTYKLF